MARFLLLALPLLLVLLALFGLATQLVGADPVVARRALLDSPRIPATVVVGSWLLEAVALLTLFLLIHGRTASAWLDGLVTGWMAWVFRGPLLALAMMAAGGRQQGWWSLVLGWFVLYSVCGLALGGLARRLAPSIAEG